MSSMIVITSDPTFEREALDEVRGVCAVTGSRSLGHGVQVLELDGADASEAWRERPPVFVRHVFPAHAELPLTGDPSADVGRLTESALDVADALDPSMPFSVQTRIVDGYWYRPRDVNFPLSEAIADRTGAAVDVRRPAQVVSVVVARPGEEILGWVGASKVEDNLSAWAGGAAIYARDPAQVSRSEMKLLEAIEAFALQLPEGGRALDLGASPGGWTRILRAAGLDVVAVDPADLHPTIAADPGVTHERTTAGVYLSRASGRFDVIVNDLRMDALRSARLMVRFARLAAPGGFAVSTVKLPRTNGGRVASQALDVLRTGWDVPVARNLFHNRSEITALLCARS